MTNQISATNWTISGLLAAIIACCVSTPVFAGGGLMVTPFTDNESRVAFSTFSVMLSSQMHAAVYSRVKGFRLRPASYYPAEIRQAYPYSVSQSPSAVFGDFNGDGFTDAVLIGDDGENTFTLLLLSRYEPGQKYDKRLSYSVKEFSKGPLARPDTGVWSYLTLRKKGRVSVPTDTSELEEIELKNDAFEVVIWEKAAVIYYLDDDGNIARVVSAD